jgi:hypothetical protein
MRCENWPSLLSDHLENAPAFQWGQNDCALWSADWVKKATGVDLTQDWRGNYSTSEEAKTFATSKGFSSYAKIASASLLPKQVAFAHRGDIVLHPQGCLGICNGLYSHFLTETGTIRFPTLNCLRAWRV